MDAINNTGLASITYWDAQKGGQQVSLINRVLLQILAQLLSLAYFMWIIKGSYGRNEGTILRTIGTRFSPFKTARLARTFPRQIHCQSLLEMIRHTKIMANRKTAGMSIE